MNNTKLGILSRLFSSKPGKTDLASSTDLAPSVDVKPKLVVPEDSMLKRHFLTQLRSVVEAEILPSSTDSSLRHYYEASVAAELQKRLAG
jgi:hypothetical protein